MIAVGKARISSEIRGRFDMKKKIAVLAAAVMLLAAVPAFAAGEDNSGTSLGNRSACGYCYTDTDQQNSGDNGNTGRYCGDGRHHHGGGCWRN